VPLPLAERRFDVACSKSLLPAACRKAPFPAIHDALMVVFYNQCFSEHSRCASLPPSSIAEVSHEPQANQAEACRRVCPGSTSEQNTKNQRRELKAAAQRQGWEVVKVYEDAGCQARRAATSAPGSTPSSRAVTRREVDLVPHGRSTALAAP